MHMKNAIEARMELSFKGEVHHLSSSLDLDKLMQSLGCLPPLQQILATDNQIDPYSYLYEMLETTPITFHQAQGLASDFLQDRILDIPGFEKTWLEQQLSIKLQEISLQELGIDDLEQHPELTRALERAYALGKG